MVLGSMSIDYLFVAYVVGVDLVVFLLIVGGWRLAVGGIADS